MPTQELRRVTARISGLFCQGSVGLGAVCYEIICPIWLRLIRLTVVSAAGMRAIVSLPQIAMGGQCLPMSDPAMSDQVHNQITGD